MLAAGLLLSAAPLWAADSHLDELLSAAAAQRLAEQPYWHVLLHYRADTLTSGVTSVVDDPRFFLSPQGKIDPDAELRATLAAFVGGTTVGDEPASCRFAARRQWLATRLPFDPARLPPLECEALDAWRRELDVQGMSLVFASSDLGHPATTFGHTLLRLERSSRAPLLALAVNYAAATGPGPSPGAYVVRGLGGGYPGVFGVFPYYEKLREYDRIEHRDLWEYPLTLDAAERERVVLHLWELRGIESDYFFLSENCSYMLLALLDAAREGLFLAREFEGPLPYVIPVDTVRSLQRAGLVGEPTLRMSGARTLRRRLAALAEPSRAWVEAYARAGAGLDDPRLATAPATEQAEMLEAAHALLYQDFNAGRVDRERGLPRAMAALEARSRLRGVATRALAPDVTPPAEGHGSSRLSAGARRATGPETAAVLRFRGAHHDRLDPAPGFLPGAELTFLDVGVTVGEAVRVADATAASAQSVVPWDPLFRSLSWVVDVGARRPGATLGLGPGRLGPHIGLGGGITAALDRGRAYAFLHTDLDAGPDHAQGWSWVAGPRAGFWMPWTATLNQEVRVAVLGSLKDDAPVRRELQLDTQWQFARDYGLRVRLETVEFGEARQRGAELLLHRYF